MGKTVGRFRKSKGTSLITQVSCSLQSTPTCGSQCWRIFIRPRCCDIPQGWWWRSPIAFASRTLTKAEKNYSQTKKLSIWCTLWKIQTVSRWQRVHFFATDHKPLLGLLGEEKPVPDMASARMQRWALTLSTYKYKLVYVPGKENANADALSHPPLPASPTSTPVLPETVHLMEQLESSPVTPEVIRSWTERDPLLSRIKRYVKHG